MKTLTHRLAMALAGYSARGSFSITHTLNGGTYPANGGTNQDTVTANYQY